jgi:hypothetical protein
MTDVSPKQARSDAKAEAAAAKARAKAMRPWYKKKRIILPLILLVVVLLAAVSSSGSKDKKTDVSSKGSSAASGETGTKSVQSSGSSAAANDVTIDACVADETLGLITPKLTILNHSSKQSNYLVSLNIEDSSGTKLGEATAASNNVDPGQTAKVDGLSGYKASGPVTCKVKSVTRYASAG